MQKWYRYKAIYSTNGANTENWTMRRVEKYPVYTYEDFNPHRLKSLKMVMSDVMKINSYFCAVSNLQWCKTKTEKLHIRTSKSNASESYW